MGRYIRRFPRVGLSLGPSEERGFALWVGYDIDGVEADLSEQGYINVDGWTQEQLAAYDVVTFKPSTAAELGIGRKSDAGTAEADACNDERRDQDRRDGSGR